MTTAAGLAGPLLDWSRDGLRDLPWRRTRDPWAILVSETMLQQTQVTRVVPRFEAFLERFPTVTACARAAAAEVIELWHGLGYNRRAINLHRAAVACVDLHHGRIPDRLDALLALPGVGPYTARAVLAFAFERDVGVVDTNVGRVLARAVAGRPLEPREAQELADSLVPAGDAWSWNQSVMELGALTCHKRSPDCNCCPIVHACAWHRAECAGPDPALGSAGTSRAQPPFAGSDRQGRGRLVAALRAGPVHRDDLPAVMGWQEQPDRALAVAAGVVADGLAVQAGDRFRLPA
jgi:A/G-specific adenine glycosylase